MDLISHLSVVCAMSNSLSTARLAVNAVYTLLGVLAGDQREQLLRPALPALVRISRAFPPLIEDCVQVIVDSVWFQSISISSLFVLCVSSWARPPPCWCRVRRCRATAPATCRRPSWRPSGKSCSRLCSATGYSDLPPSLHYCPPHLKNTEILQELPLSAQLQS